MYLIPLLSTLMSSVFCGAMPLVSRSLGHRGVVVFSILSLTIAFVSSSLIWIDLYLGGAPVWLELCGPWFEVGTVSVSWIFYFDLLTAHMLLTVTSVSLAVHIYATVYMRSDPHLSLFMSYLSLFTFFMLVYVCGDNLVVMLVGWEGNQHHCLNGIKINKTEIPELLIDLSGLSLISSKKMGSKPLNHSYFFHQLVVGFLLGDGWLEKRGNSIRLGISLTFKFKDVAQTYKTWLYGLGYINSYILDEPLMRRKNKNGYYQIRTNVLHNFNEIYADWYVKSTFPSYLKHIKVVPTNIEECFTPLMIAIWIMGDGSGMKDGGFKISSHGFTREENQFLCDLFEKRYQIKATVVNEKGKYTFIRIWKRSTPQLFAMVKPYLLGSCFYKLRFIKS